MKYYLLILAALITSKSWASYCDSNPCVSVTKCTAINPGYPKDPATLVFKVTNSHAKQPINSMVLSLDGKNPTLEITDLLIRRSNATVNFKDKAFPIVGGKYSFQSYDLIDEDKLKQIDQKSQLFQILSIGLAQKAYITTDKPADILTYALVVATEKGTEKSVGYHCAQQVGISLRE